MAGILGPDGKPYQENALDWLTKQGVERRDNGDLVISEDVMRRLRAERARDLTVSQVARTPRFMNRNAGGVGVEKGHGQFESLSLATLRKIRERSPMLQPIHQARQYQVRRLAQRWSGKKGDVGWRVVHKDHTEWDAQPPDSIKPFIAKFEAMFERPSAECPTVGTLLTLLEEDFLTINRPVVQKLESLFDRRRIVGFEPVDGNLIWPTLLWVEKWWSDHPTWYGYTREQLTEEQRIDVVSEALEWELHGADYCQVREGILEAVFERHQLIVAPLRNRTDVQTAGYPPSHVEQAIEMVMAHINAWDLNTSLYTRGMLAEFILGVSGDVADEDIQAFVDMLRDATQGVRRAWQPPVMPLPMDGTITKIDLRPTPKDMVQELWFSVLGSLMAAIYRMDMSTVNMKPWDGGGGSKLNEPSRYDEIALAKEEGLQGDMQHLTEAIFNPLAASVHPDLRLRWEYGDFDPKREADIYEVKGRTSMTRNEIRLQDGQQPMGFWIPPEELKAAQENDDQETLDKFHNNLWNMPTDPGFTGAKQQQTMAAQMQDQQQQQGPDGYGGQPGEDDGYGGAAGADGGYGGDQQAGAGGFPYGQMPMAKAHRGRITVYVRES